MNWLQRALIKTGLFEKDEAVVPLETPAPPDREPSLMIFNPEDHGTKCDLCGAGMESFISLTAHGYYDEKMELRFSCGQTWRAPSREDLYWTPHGQCSEASTLLREARK